jgi:uncharacterized SAM-binding protein YcdF (DUF218 family)
MRRFLFGVLVGITLLLLVEVGALVLIGHALAVSDPLEKSDVIVAVSGDEGLRMETAVELWRLGYAPFLLFSGASLDPTSMSSAEIMKRQAVELGVPASAILVEPNSATTEENAHYVAQVMTEHSFRSAILVTSPYHQRRASILFARSFAPAGLTFRNHPADDPSWDEDRWWIYPRSRTLTVIELAKLGAVIARG